MVLDTRSRRWAERYSPDSDDFAAITGKEQSDIGRPGAGRIVRLTWQEARPPVQIIFALRFLAGAVLAGGVPALLSRHVLLSLLGWCCVVAAVYVHNGTEDVVEDRRNASQRPVAAGRLPVGTARAVARALAAAGLLASAALDPRAGALAALMLACGWAYSSGARPWKNTVPGFVFIVVSGGLLTYLAGSVAVGARWSAPLCCFALVMSCWMAVAGSTKDLPDSDGDRCAGRRTLPVLYGQRRAARLTALGTLAVGAGFHTVALHHVPTLLTCASVLLVGAVVIAVTLVATPADAGRDRRRRPYRAFMITQYAVHSALFVSALLAVM